jgi:CubicO group peptidase (beta-lactamase class C family)
LPFSNPNKFCAVDAGRLSLQPADQNNMNYRMKGSGLFVLSVTLLVVSCGQAAQNAKAVAQTDTMSPVATTIPALTGPELEHYSSISGRFFDSMLAGRFNGSVLVAKNGVVIYERYKGFKNPRMRKDSVGPHTAFHLASMSKTFTAMGTLKLWQEGKLDIHDPVAKYLTGFPFPDVTIQTLLNHRSGLHNYVHFMYKPDVDKHKLLNNGDVLQYIIHHSRDRDIFSGQVNRHFEYSNTNYAMLALIIEKVSGLPYPEFMGKTFFEPLGMQDTYVYNLSDSAGAMLSYYQTGRPFRMEFLDLVYGDKNIYSTVRDMYKWDQALRNGQLFSKGVLDSAYAGYSFEKPGQRNYGLGWRMLMIPNGKKLIYHNGWWHGNRTVFLRMLDENATIIALTNNDYKNVYSAKRLCDLFGDYRQGHESFDEGESDPAGDPGPGAGDEPHEVKPVAVAPPVHHPRHHRVKKPKVPRN